MLFWCETRLLGLWCRALWDLLGAKDWKSANRLFTVSIVYQSVINCDYHFFKSYFHRFPTKIEDLSNKSGENQGKQWIFTNFDWNTIEHSKFPAKFLPNLKEQLMKTKENSWFLPICDRTQRKTVGFARTSINAQEHWYFWNGWLINNLQNKTIKLKIEDW